MLRKLGLGRTAEVLRQIGPLAALHRWNEPHLSDRVPGPGPTLRRELARYFTKDMQAVAEALGRHDLPWSSWDLLKDGGAPHKVDAA